MPKSKSNSTPPERESDDKQRALSLALEKIEKDFGKGSIMRLGAAPRARVNTYATGSVGLDIALGVGGVPKGRIIEMFGPEASGKSTVAMHVCAEVQKTGGVAAFIDAEHAMDPEYCKRLGVDVDQLLISQPDTGEQALEILDQLVRCGAVELVVVDSVAALVPRAEIEGEMGDSLPGLQARLMSQALRKIAGICSRTGATVIFINQLRQKIGVTFGSPETTTGGQALKFYASVRLDIRRIETLKKDGVEYGNKVRVKVTKNKVAPPFRTAEFEIVYGQGISRESELVDLGVKTGSLKKSGAWYSLVDPDSGDDIRIGQGKDAAIQHLRDNPEITERLREEALVQFGPDKTEDQPEEQDPTPTDDQRTSGSQ